MRDHEVTQVLNALDSLWSSKRQLDEGARSIWGAHLSRHGHDDVMRAIMALVQTSKWRPSLAELLDHVKTQGRQRSLEESKRRALSPAPDEPMRPIEQIRALVAPIMETTRPTRVENMAGQELRRAVGSIGQRRQWGAYALMVLAERAAQDDGPACDVLDEVAQRAAGGGA